MFVRKICARLTLMKSSPVVAIVISSGLVYVFIYLEGGGKGYRWLYCFMGQTYPFLRKAKEFLLT
jgi:hypothetical protein